MARDVRKKLAGCFLGAGVLRKIAAIPLIVVMTMALTVTTPRDADAAAMACAPRLHVWDIGVDIPAADGTTWFLGFRRLEEALAAASMCVGTTTEIWVATSAIGEPYRPAGAGGSPAISFEMVDGVSIYGGFDGTIFFPGSSLADADPDAHVTVLSGDLNQDDVGFTNNSENAYHVVSAQNTLAPATLWGFTITGGNARGSLSGESNGGGIFIDGGDLTIRRTRVEQNVATNNGAGIALTFAGLGTPSVLNMVDSVVDSNVAGIGSGIGWGAGIHQLGAEVTAVNSEITNNSTDGFRGAAMFSAGGNVDLINVLIAGNTGTNTTGSAMFLDGGTVTAVNTTITDNSVNAGLNDHAIYIQANGTVIADNTIIWGNSGDALTGSSAGATLFYTFTPTNSDIEGMVPTGTNVDVDPMFVGPGDYRLQSASTLIDEGDFNLVPADDFDADEDGDVTELTPDLDLFPRVIGNDVDMGAYENVPLCNGLDVTIVWGPGAVATSGNDVILGTAGADVIPAGDGNDTVCGLGGDDTINGGPGNDTLFGDDGADQIFGLSGADTIDGGDGDDTVVSGAGMDDIDGGAGDDTLNGGSDDDSIDGGDGDDDIFGQGGADTLNGDAGDDFMIGLDGLDTINGGDDNDTVNGGPGDDVLHGDAGDDVLFGLDGDDTAHGDAGEDLVFGQVGADTVDGGADDDFVWGNEGNDILTDPSGANTLNGGPDDDTVTGGTGPDQIFGDGNLLQAGNDTLTGGAGVDLIVGFNGVDTLNANDGEADTVNGGPNAGDTCDTDALDNVFNCS